MLLLSLFYMLRLYYVEWLVRLYICLLCMYVCILNFIYAFCLFIVCIYLMYVYFSLKYASVKICLVLVKNETLKAFHFPGLYYSCSLHLHLYILLKLNYNNKRFIYLIRTYKYNYIEIKSKDLIHHSLQRG